MAFDALAMTVFASWAAAVDVISPASARATTHVRLMIPSDGMKWRVREASASAKRARLHYVVARFRSRNTCVIVDARFSRTAPDEEFRGADASASATAYRWDLPPRVAAPRVPV